MTGSVPTSFSDDPLEIIEKEAVAVARCFGVAAPEVTAASLIQRILLRLGGEHVYFPKRSSRDQSRVRAEIVARFNGKNLFELARVYEMTTRHLRRISEKGNRDELNRGLFS